MSIDLNWDTVTSGPDGEALAEKIRAFIDDKFQQIALPRFINSVHVHSFDFGEVSPELEIKDICDPLPDFYEDDETDSEHEEGQIGEGHDQDRHGGNRLDQEHLSGLQRQILNGDMHQSQSHAVASTNPHQNSVLNHSTRIEPGRFAAQSGPGDHFFPRSNTPGIPGGTSNLSYFHLPLGGFSGTQTPLAAVASGTPFSTTGWHHDVHQQFGFAPHHSGLAPAPENAPLEWTGAPDPNFPTRPSTASSLASPPDPSQPMSPTSPDMLAISYDPAIKVSDEISLEQTPANQQVRVDQSQPTDVQVVARVKYAGNIRMTLTAEILLDYPMPSFVGIPVKLSITGMTFDGVAIVAYIRKRIHFCFLSPEDAEALVGDKISAELGRENAVGGPKRSLGGLLQEIHVESEIGRKESGKLKNVGKVEKFVLEQVRRIFEEEFVFPSFWTFLV